MEFFIIDLLCFLRSYKNNSFQMSPQINFENEL